MEDASAPGGGGEPQQPRQPPNVSGNNQGQNSNQNPQLSNGNGPIPHQPQPHPPDQIPPPTSLAAPPSPAPTTNYHRAADAPSAPMSLQREGSNMIQEEEAANHPGRGHPANQNPRPGNLSNVGNQINPAQHQQNSNHGNAQQQHVPTGPSQATSGLWKEVAHGLDKSSTVVWTKAVESLEAARRHLHPLSSTSNVSSNTPHVSSILHPPCPEAREFVNKYMITVVSILLEQQPSKIGQMEKDCVEKSVRCALAIVRDDLIACGRDDLAYNALASSGKLSGAITPTICPTLDVLANIFNKKKVYYKGNKGWNNSTMGLPHVRISMISKFRQMKGFAHLATYLNIRAGVIVNSPMGPVSVFPGFDVIQQLLTGVHDATTGLQQQQQQQQQQNMNSGGGNGNCEGLVDQLQQAAQRMESIEQEARHLCQAVMKHFSSLSEETLKRIPSEAVKQTNFKLQCIYERLALSNPRVTFEFFSFWRSLIWKYLTSQSLPLKLFGWEQVGDIIDACRDNAPPPRAYIVSGAGCSFINGTYEFDPSKVDKYGFVQPNVEISYEMTIPFSKGPSPESAGESTNGGTTGATIKPGKKITLFRCTMRSQQKWWFLSEADEDQPGTDKDIDYYQHKSRQNEEKQPPVSGWATCRAGVDPPPTLRPVGAMVPPGEEYNTLEHQLAKWAIENGVIELVLGDSIHREIVARSTCLINFLASMCDKDDENEVPPSGESSMQTEMIPNQYCLKSSHLLLAWKTCMNKADAAVSAEIYQLLVNILPSLSKFLAVPLIKEIHNSLSQTSEKGDHFYEVSEFCDAIATSNNLEGETNGSITSSSGSAKKLGMNAEVREEILSLQWAVLTHEDARTLKSYESIKKYVACEIRRQEPMTDRQRDIFLSQCQELVGKNSVNEVVDEVDSLHMVQLTRFVLEAYPRDKIETMIASEEEWRLPKLLLSELIAYLNRREKVQTLPPARKPSSTSVVPEFNHVLALKKRLAILRYVYGLSPTAIIGTSELDHLWSLCSKPTDREAIMSFLATASQSGARSLVGGQVNGPNADQQYSAFASDTSIYIFENLFCSVNVGWESLGDIAYHSFRSVYENIGKGKTCSLDALWRICLTAGIDSIATHAMNDLLAAYDSVELTNSAGNAWSNSHHVVEETFSKRIFNEILAVNKGLLEGDATSERSAERCIRILKAAIDRCSSLGGSASAAAERMASLPPSSSLQEYLSRVPHGLRGQFSCKTVFVVAKDLRSQSGQSEPSPRPSPSESSIQRCDRFKLDIHPLETLAAIRRKVATHCNHDVDFVKPTSLSGRAGTNSNPGSSDMNRLNLNTVPETTLAVDMGIVDGSEMIVMLSNKPLSSPALTPGPNIHHGSSSKLDLSMLFDSRGSSEGSSESSDLFFETLISMLQALPMRDDKVTDQVRSKNASVNTHELVWGLLLAMPTNAGMIERVRIASMRSKDGSAKSNTDDAMVVDSYSSCNASPLDVAHEDRSNPNWSNLLDFRQFERSVYVMQVIDSILRPEPGMFSSLNREIASHLGSKMLEEAKAFLTEFIQSGGFDAVMNLFIQSGNADKKIRRRNRMGNAFALRILTFSLLGSNGSDVVCDRDNTSPHSSSGGETLIKTLPNPIGFLSSLIGVVVDDEGITNSTILRVLQLVRMMLMSDNEVAASFVNLPVTETFLTSLLLWDEAGFARSQIESAFKVRRSTEDMILDISLLSTSALPWLVKALSTIDPSTDGSCEFFFVLMKLVGSVNQNSNQVHLKDLGSAVCNKLASYPHQTRENMHVDYPTGVLCGCLRLLTALVVATGGAFIVEGSSFLLRSLNTAPWSQDLYPGSGQNHSNNDGICEEDKALIDLMGAIFDGFISSAISPGLTPICCDNDSRHFAFNVAFEAAKKCRDGKGYNILVTKICGIISHVAPSFRHSWGQNSSNDEGNTVSSSSSVNYSGLRNQGCTCYMNSFLQQLFMMPALRKSICSAVIPSCLRSSGGGTMTKGSALVGKKISLHWDCGNSYDAIVDSYNEHTGMHTISYCPIQLATPVGPAQIHSIDMSSLPKELPEEFILSEGRPGKETGAFEILSNNSVSGGPVAGENSLEILHENIQGASEVKESEDEASSRRLLEEVQRTFVNLEEARGRCFDPRSLVEASNCLKLEFDVWQQNDASEFAMKLLDRLEIPLKRWSPKHFKYLAHTFGLKSTKQKICKECGLKTNREESLMNIDCQIRNKTNIHEALSTMCEDEIMEGDNKVLCDRCKIKTNTVLRTAVSALPDMLVLSLKRFDLDYNTFETVKLNSRCEFGESLNMKQYTLEAKEILESVRAEESKSDGGSMMDIGENDANEDPDKDPLSVLPDEDYEYKLAGVLVHAGVAQGGHYYSFIKHRVSNKWYRFDDEDVTSFDPALIEQECFGGKVKKETKFPNGNVHIVESEQFANALMLFYEKVKPVIFEESTEKKNIPDDGSPMEEESSDPASLELSSGYDVFLPEVRKSNSTHSWQSFLLTNEFQAFVRGMLDLCTETSKYSNEQDNNMDITPVSSPSPVVIDIDIDSWRFGIVKMALSYVFDIIFHLSLSKDVLQQWSTKFKTIFSASSDVTSTFVADLARRTNTVYENWIRAFTVECSEEIPRREALEMFKSAIFAHLSHPTEQSLLRDWVQRWRAQVSEFERLLMNKRQHIGSMPTKLVMFQSQELEDVSRIGENATGIGIILSFLTMLTELLPRYVQTNCDLYYFIRELASNKGPEGHLLREAMNEAQFPARLTCLAIRDKSHSLMRHSFPGASVSFEIVEALSKQETSSSSLIHMGNPGMNSGQSSYIPSAHNQIILLEAIGCLLNMQWVKQEPICFETGEVNRGRAMIALSDKAVEALTIMFHDCKRDSVEGLTKTDIEHCMSFFRVDVPPQRIESAFNRHAVVDENDGTKILPLYGFLAYYRDLAQTSEHQVRCDIQHFGFRPDLTRRVENTRWYTDESGKWPFTDTESIACDVALNRELLSNITKVPELNLFSLPFMIFANNNSTPLAEYLLAAVAFGKDTSRLMQDALKQYNHNAGNWGAPDLISACILVFRVLVSIPDDRQMDRINMLMLNDDKGRNGVAGLIKAGEEIVNRYQGNDQYYNGVVERYVELIKDLQEHNAVNLWMKKNKSCWEWMNEDNEIRPDGSPPLSSRRGHSGMHQNQQGNSDSDANAEANDSDEDSEYYDYAKAAKYMTVDGSGIAQVNGTYERAGSCDGVAKYVRIANWEGEEEDFMIFRCQLSDRSRRWYISIVPHNIHPGTTKDIDFFAAAAPDRSCVPPREGWIAVIRGKPHPINPPSVYPVEQRAVDCIDNDGRSTTYL